MSRHIIIDLAGKHKTESDELYLVEIRKAFFCIFIQRYLHCLFTNTFLNEIKCVCELRIVTIGKKKYLSVNSWISRLHVDTTRLIVSFRSSDNEYVLEKVNINKFDSFDANLMTGYEYKELQILFKQLDIIAPEYLSSFRIEHNEPFDYTLSRLKEIKNKRLNSLGTR